MLQLFVGCFHEPLVTGVDFTVSSIYRQFPGNRPLVCGVCQIPLFSHLLYVIVFPIVIQVKYLQIAKKSKTYNPYRWVRYVTQANSYVARIWTIGSFKAWMNCEESSCLKARLLASHATAGLPSVWEKSFELPIYLSLVTSPWDFSFPPFLLDIVHFVCVASRTEVVCVAVAELILLYIVSVAELI